MLKEALKISSHLALVSREVLRVHGRSLWHTTPAMHIPKHVHSQPCMPSAMHTPQPCMPPRHACSLGLHYPWAHMRPSHARPPVMHTPSHARPPSMHALQQILRDTINERAVRILLECILVLCCLRLKSCVKISTSNTKNIIPFCFFSIQTIS